MFAADKNMNLYLTRGDGVLLPVSCKNSEGKAYTFKSGETLTLRVFKKRRCAETVLTKTVTVASDSETVEIYLSSADTKIGDAINGPVEYWYEVELNSGSEASQTVIGYDRRGPKVFRLYPEGADGEESGNGTPSSELSAPLVGYVLDPEAVHGRSAYELALLNGFEGTEEEWLASLSENAAKGCVNYFANALVGNEPDWDGSAILFDDVSPLDHKVKVTSNGYAIAPIVSCGKNILSINKVTFPFTTCSIFEGRITGDLYFSYKTQLENAANTTLFKVYFSGTHTRHTGTGTPVSVTSEEVNGVANLTRDGAVQHYFKGTITKIEAYNWTGAAEGSSFYDIQLEVGAPYSGSDKFEDKFTAFEPYKEGEMLEVVPQNSAEFKSISPNMTLYMNDTIGDSYEIGYNKDANKVIERLTQAIISLGGNI